MAKCSLDINKKHWISPIFLWLRRTAVTCSTQWQILKCNLKFVPVSNLIESQPPAAEASLSDNKDSAAIEKYFKSTFFISSFRNSTQTAIMMIISKYFQFWSEIWNVKMREILFSRQETKTQTELGWWLVSVCVYTAAAAAAAASCLMFMIFLRMIAVTGEGWGLTHLSVWAELF